MNAVRLFVFLGAFLLFTMEPMVGRMLLPHFGGAFHVWTTSLMFFQGVLFFAYAYAHLGEPRLGRWHFAAIAIPLLSLPPTVVILGVHDVPALLLALARASALPFAALATTSVVAQHWVSRSSLPDRDNPYWLYGTSNVGSMAALLIYALVIEPLVGVSAQRIAFSIGFALWLGAGVLAYRATRPTSAAVEKPEPSAPVADETITAGRIAYWLLLSACPSALLMAVTNLIALDAGNVPLVWVIPLALYLLTFVLAFRGADRNGAPESAPDAQGSAPPARGESTLVPDWVRRLWPHVGAVAIFLWSGADTGGQWTQIVLHAGLFFIICLAAHAELYASRPSSRRLTLFYLVLSLGGWIGGAFVALVAPAIFWGLAEYPVAIVALALTVVVGRRKDIRAWWRDAGLLPAIAAIGMTIALGAVMLLKIMEGMAQRTGDVHEIAHARSFYGIYHVVDLRTTAWLERDLISGVTRHGRQFIEGPDQREPLSYYHREGSLGQVMTLLREHHRPLRIAAIGLGVGAAAAYAEPGDDITFFEIDALDDQLARRHFHYLADCRGTERTVIGDARVTLEEQASSSSPPRYDLILVDAFSGDAIPTHLVTREAAQLYFRLLASDGYLLFHVSNRYYDLRPVLAGISRDLDHPGAWRRRFRPTGVGEDQSEYVVFPPREEDLATFDDTGWTRFSAGGLPTIAPWTDDHTNTLAILDLSSR